MPKPLHEPEFDTRDRRAAACDGKVAYPNGAIAHRVFRRTRAHKFQGAVYRCRFCRGFHIGNRS
jgi:hypothetical protein